VEKENEEKIKETLVCSSGDVYQEESTSIAAEKEEAEAAETVATPKQNQYVKQLKQNPDVKFLWEKFYIIDSTTSVTKNLFPVKELLEENLSLPVKKGKKQILIYHTHGASEKFADSTKNEEDSIVGVGTVLAQELEKKGYGVYHDRTKYDWIDGSLNRSLAYNEALKGIEKIRAQYKDIHVMIDLHRDSIGKGRHTYATIGGKKTAIVMFFNGMSRTKNGPIEYLQNNNLQGNLAFSLQLKCKAMECYDGFTKPIYLKGYRYNLHLEKRSLLIELGNENNTVEEAKNAAKPLADVIYRVLANVT
ncbi:MAG: stage II sporulation protein P, partial [Eubacterium sp.]|nr:stage II sporulation protein P [Eubacterium sp.]